MIEVYHAQSDTRYEYRDGLRWHIDDKAQLHILGVKDADGFRATLASFARGEWSTVRQVLDDEAEGASR